MKGVASEPDAVVAALMRAGAEPLFAGRLSDRRYDTPDRALAARDHVLRLRVHSNAGGSRASIDWKGPTGYDAGYKVREELTTAVGDAGVLAQQLERLGYEITREIDRDIAQFGCAGAVVRVERYPRMDTLVEVEGPSESIETAIAATGIARAAFTAERLADFVRRFEARTGQRAALCDRELAGDYRYDAADA